MTASAETGQAERIYLWRDGEIPYFRPEYGEFQPYVDLYLLEEDNAGAKHPCILVIPGGAYGFVSIEGEGKKICRFLNAHGYSAVMLNYRVAPYAYPCMLFDAQRAIRTIRYHAEAWHVDPAQIGSIGFSAGGHLCCLTAFCGDDGLPEGDEIDAVSCRVYTAAPCYAVTSLDPAITHRDTRAHFLGEEGDDALAYDFSAENMIGENVPPIFLWHTAEDDCVKPECSLRLAGALIAKKVPCELHIFPYGGHGSDLAEQLPLADQWPALYIRWLDHYSRK